jgi:hypothetical protein
MLESLSGTPIPLSISSSASDSSVFSPFHLQNTTIITLDILFYKYIIYKMDLGIKNKKIEMN